MRVVRASQPTSITSQFEQSLRVRLFFCVEKNTANFLVPPDQLLKVFENSITWDFHQFGRLRNELPDLKIVILRRHKEQSSVVHLVASET